MIESVLGAGGTSRVYVARQLSVDRLVALKVFRLQQGSPESSIQRLSREARLLARLDHDRIVRCYDFGREGAIFYLALELVDGESLKARLDREGPLPESQAIAVTRAVAEALGHAHEHGIIHRDIKPANILLSRAGKVKLTDFGLARVRENVELTVPGTMVGTPQYLSPEQARDPSGVDRRSDIYSLGASLYHMLAGVPPHQGESLTEVISQILFARIQPPEEHRPELSPALSRVIARMMARPRELRYRSAAELLADLDRLQSAGPTTGALPGISWERALAPETERPTRRLWMALAPAAVLLLAGLGWWVWSRGGPEQTAGSRAAGVGSAAVSAPEPAQLVSGSVSVVAGWRALSNPSLPPEVRRELQQAVVGEARRRAELIGVAALAAAREAVAEGRLEQALERFDREVDLRVRAGLGAEREQLVSELADLLEAELLTQRQTAEQDLVLRARRQADESIELDLESELGRVQDDLSERRYRECLERLRATDAAAEERVARMFRSAIRSVVPGARDPRPSASWQVDAAQSFRVALSKILGRVLRTVAGARALGLRSIESYAVDQQQLPERDQIEHALRRTVVEALGVPIEDFPGELGPIEDAISRRTDSLYGEVVAIRTNRRKTIEAGAVADLERALGARDFALAETAGRSLGDPERILDPWLRQLVEGSVHLGRIDQLAFAALERQKGQRIGITAQGILRTGTLLRIDRSSRTLVFESPSFRVSYDELQVSEILAWAGGSAPPRAAALLLFFGDQLERAEQIIAVHSAETWATGFGGALARRRAELQRERDGQLAEVRTLLERFDQAVERGVPEEVVASAEKLLQDPDLRRLAPVEKRLRELHTAAESGRRTLKVQRRRNLVRDRTAAEVRFSGQGQVELTHRFDSTRELDDFRLPGPEWSVRGDGLTSVGSRPGAGSPDLFTNRPGVVRRLPFDLDQPVQVRFDLELPYEQATPALVGVRLMSTCFAVRSFGENSYPGQVNAWRGDLDDSGDYLFEPSLGDSRPSKRGAGPVRPFAFERGNRYRITIEWQPGSPSLCTLAVDGDTVYRYRVLERPRVSELEIRSRTPVRIDDLLLLGTISGTELK